MEDAKQSNMAETARIRKAAKRHDYFKALWVFKGGNPKHRHRIIKRVGCYVYLRWAELGAYPPRGLSRKVTVGELLENYELSSQHSTYLICVDCGNVHRSPGCCTQPRRNMERI